MTCSKGCQDEKCDAGEVNELICNVMINEAGQEERVFKGVQQGNQACRYVEVVWRRSRKNDAAQESSFDSSGDRFGCWKLWLWRESWRKTPFGTEWSKKRKGLSKW